MSLTQLKGALAQLRGQVETRQHMRRAQRVKERQEEREHNLAAQHLMSAASSADVQALLDGVVRAVLLDKELYAREGQVAAEAPAPAAPPPLPVAAPVQPAATQDDGAVSPVMGLPAEMMAARARAAAAHEPLETPMPTGAGQALLGRTASVHLRPLLEGWQRVERLLPQEGVGEKLPGPQRACYAFLHHELASLLEEQGQRHTVSAPLLAKIRQALDAFANGRSSDTVTLLKNALSGDPHNHAILAMLSQVLYLFSATKQQNALPEAREYAQRSGIHSEKISAEKLALYRYMAMVAELNFSPERVRDWLRETDMLNTRYLNGSGKLFGHKGLPLRAWAILSQIPAKLWGDYEVASVRALLAEVPGGGAMYLLWFREPLLQISAVAKLPLGPVQDMEQMLASARMAYEDTAAGLSQLMMRPAAWPWFLRMRFLNTVTQVAPVPAFDQVLCMVSMNGERCMENVFPDSELRSLLDSDGLSYWRLWMMVITPYKDIRQPFLLPAAETVQDAPLLAACAGALSALQQAEKEKIKIDLWEDLRPYMSPWQIEHLLAAGTGSNRPGNRFMPSLVPYTHFYRNWRLPVPTSPLASEVIAEHARRGSFASMFEIMAAFEGAMMLLNNPVYGLAANQKRALLTAKKHNPKKFESVSVDFGGIGGGGMLAVLVPLALIGAVAAIVQLSANWGQALGLILALAGVAGVVVINLVKR